VTEHEPFAGRALSVERLLDFSKRSAAILTAGSITPASTRHGQPTGHANNQSAGSQPRARRAQSATGRQPLPVRRASKLPASICSLQRHALLPPPLRPHITGYLGMLRTPSKVSFFQLR